MWDRDAWARRARTKPPKDTPPGWIGTLRAAAVAYRNLTGSAEWDRYLGVLQGRVEELGGELRAQQDAILSVRTGGYEELVRLKLAVALLQGELAALEWAMALPKTVIAAVKELPAQAPGD